MGPAAPASCPWPPWSGSLPASARGWAGPPHTNARGGGGAADTTLVVGAAEGDDAAVLRLDDERALVLTTDFFTPIVDDPRDWGGIPAATALSDVSATAGRP